ncbi:hypothetical protein KFE25_005238 [Diacronema lutheri]|uniref:Uncharacterized protein n=2 Tax=Diacronema lutheri TaxID=2081491 RepID=A0A8J6C519_DIALT|nr:hypothetical protein KFE25_005238 [Diacronema lutheri]
MASGWAARLLALSAVASVSSLATGPPRAAALLRARAAPTRAAPACAIDLAECLSAFLTSGNVGCVSEATSAAAAGVVPTRAVVDDVVAGLTGGFVGVAGTVISLELGKQAVKEQLRCNYCAGEGRLKCGQCYGKGCAACGGTGHVTCVSCGGSGRAVSTDMEKAQFRAVFGLFPEMRYGPESTLFDERDEMTNADWQPPHGGDGDDAQE